MSEIVKRTRSFLIRIAPVIILFMTLMILYDVLRGFSMDSTSDVAILAIATVAVVVSIGSLLKYGLWSSE